MREINRGKIIGETDKNTVRYVNYEGIIQNGGGNLCCESLLKGRRVEIAAPTDRGLSQSFAFLFPIKYPCGNSSPD